MQSPVGEHRGYVPLPGVPVETGSMAEPLVGDAGKPDDGKTEVVLVNIGAATLELVMLVVPFGDGTGKPDDADADSVEVETGAADAVELAMGAVCVAEVEVAFCVGNVLLPVGTGTPEGAVPLGAPPAHEPCHAAIQPGAGYCTPVTAERNSHCAPS